MKFPANTTALIEAKMYAIESITHTMDYEGWGDAHAKAVRIMTGNYCQLWLAEFCELNGITCQKDRSSPYIADKGDATINEWVVDSKASLTEGLEGQISPHHDKQSGIDFYVFFSTDRDFSFIEPLGFIHTSDVVSSSIRVEQGEKIPGTNFIQRFQYSYFVKRECMQPFWKTLQEMQMESKTQRQSRAVIDYSKISASEDSIPF